MSNYMENEIRNLLALINWGTQSWESVTFKMLEGGNQVIERMPREWNPQTHTTTIPETEERRICGNLDSENLAQFIAQAPSILFSAQTEIGAAGIRIEKMKKEHEDKVKDLLYDVSVEAALLKDAKESRDHWTKLYGESQKKLSRYEKKRKQKGGKK